MTTGEIIAVVSLLVLVALVLHGIRGHRGESGNDHENGWWKAQGSDPNSD